MGLNTKIVLRPMALTDVPLLNIWDQQPHVIAATSDDPNETLLKIDAGAIGDAVQPNAAELEALSSDSISPDIDASVETGAF